MIFQMSSLRARCEKEANDEAKPWSQRRVPRQTLPTFSSLRDPFWSKNRPSKTDFGLQGHTKERCRQKVLKSIQNVSQNGPQNDPKSTPNGDHHWPRALFGAFKAQDDAKRRPRAFQEAPRRPKESPGGSKWHQKRPQDTKKGPQRHRNLSKREFRKHQKRRR